MDIGQPLHSRPGQQRHPPAGHQRNHPHRGWQWNQRLFGRRPQATNARLSSPADVVVDAVGNFYIADSGNKRIRKVSISSVISTVAGSGNAGYYGNGGQATNASWKHQPA